MIAYVGIPGSSHHIWERFCGKTERAEAVRWAEKQCDRVRENNPSVGSLPCGTYSEKDAAKVRYQDGSRVYPPATSSEIEEGCWATDKASN